MSRRFGDSTIGGGGSPTASNRSFGASKRFGGKTNYSRREKKLSAQEALEMDKKKALESFEPEKMPPTFMYVSVSGIIQSGSVSAYKLDKLAVCNQFIDETFYVCEDEV
jgi:hypothetical protein